MNSLLDKLNLRPQERRIVVGVGVLVFVVLNLLFVMPHLNDLGKTELALDRARRSLQTYETEIAKTSISKERLKVLQGTGSEVLNEELQLQRIVQTEATTSGLMVNRYDPRPRVSITKTNQFFEDQFLTIDFNSDGKSLVDFLSNLALGNSMIRVREMNIKPDASQTRLVGSLLFVASYQKKQAAAPTPARLAATTPAKASPPSSTVTPTASESLPAKPQPTNVPAPPNRRPS
ncbi:MAG: hypothetical protein DVB32_08170 [Verrucomicrobia bacterium]|nr:MAG: hypothetical protein DVB32_08170 [Verrucomicrobiota bacterium]